MFVVLSLVTLLPLGLKVRYIKQFIYSKDTAIVLLKSWLETFVFIGKIILKTVTFEPQKCELKLAQNRT